MSRTAAQDPAPPIEVLVEFLYALGQTVSPYDRIVPVLRGSTLLRHWFGEAARPAADVDLEWFPQPGWGGRFVSPIEHARGLCMYAVDGHEDFPVRFYPHVPVPADGVSLWEYDTPGARCYTGWTWDDRGLRGVLQIDLAQAGSYDLAGVAPEPVELPRAWGEPARLRAYSPEMLLAAKLSWIVRHVRRDTASEGRPFLSFLGEAKDLFDVHLLLTAGRPRPEVFQNALLAVAAEDRLDWQRMDLLLDPELAPPEGVGVQDRTRTLRTVIERLRPLMGDLRQHLLFLRPIGEDPSDAANLLIYADWLEDRRDPRAEFLRLCCRWFFHEDAAARAGRGVPSRPAGRMALPRVRRPGTLAGDAQAPWRAAGLTPSG